MTHVVLTYLSVLLIVFAFGAAETRAQSTSCDASCPTPCYFGRCPISPGDNLDAVLKSQPSFGSGKFDRVAVFRDWSVFSDLSGGQRVCWVATKPIRRSDSLRSADIYIMVTVDPDELSVTSETGSFTAVKSATLEFDQVVIDLYFENGSGWTDNKTGDINALRMLADEQSGTIYFENAEIEFSGEGFLQAYSNARALCE